MYDNIADDLVRKILCGNSILHEVCYVVFTFLPVALDIIICPSPFGCGGSERSELTERARTLARSAALSQKAALQMLLTVTTPPVKRQFWKIRRFSRIAKF